MSYELADASVRDVRDPVWILDEATFTGAAILLKKKAAYENTSIELVANRDFKMEKPMTHKQTEELMNVTQRMASAAEALSESIARLNAQHDELSVRVDKIVAALETNGGEEEDEAILLKSRIAELEAVNADLREKAKHISLNAPPLSPSVGD